MILLKRFSFFVKSLAATVGLISLVSFSMVLTINFSLLKPAKSFEYFIVIWKLESPNIFYFFLAIKKLTLIS
ncbi:hypothetical protein K9M16_01570 [Candidatus Babeliales bacterium]|nr:hypothetical protein [Candidatus Babeliales bacterium]